MKRILALLLALLLLTGCSTDATEENTVNTISPTDAVTNAATVPETKEPMEEPTEVSPEAETEAPTETSTEEPAEPPTTEPPATEHKHNYSSRVTAPTCTQKGYTTYTCACGHSYKDTETNATGHDYKKTVVSPTKTAQGYTLYECKNCDYSYKDNYTDKLPSDHETEPVHQHSYKSKVTAPTCTAKGYTTYTCDCGHSYKGDEKPALGHDWDNGKVTKKPTCTAEGVKTYTCKPCGETKNETIAKTGHDYKDTVVKPTCTEKGYTLHKCKNCNHSYKDSEKAALGHDWDSGKVTKKATCSAEGVKTYTCKRSGCGKTKTETIAKTAHDYKTTVVAPTCTENGYTLHECKNCPASVKDSKTNALGHKWGNWVVTKEPTTTAEGVETRACSRSGCGATETRPIDKLVEEHKHNYKSEITKAATCTEDGVKTFTCSCGDSYTETIAKTGHSWGDWVRTKEPTTKAEGQETRTCKRDGCGATETRAVEKLPSNECTNHSWGNWTSNDNGSTRSCTACGETQVIDGSDSNYAKDVINIINKYREAEGLQPVEWFTWNMILIRADELTVSYSHNRPDGSRGIGTCIAAGYGSAQAVVDGWMGSSSHRGSLMNPNATEASAAYNGSYWVLYIG